MRSKVIPAIVICLCLQVAGWAQYTAQLPNIKMPSPGVMDVQKYGDYPVSHFTGIPNISIPLFTIKEGDLEVPISISYHNSGYRADISESMLGLGWTLNFGGQVSWTIMDEEDQRTSRIMFNNRPFPTKDYVDLNVNNLFTQQDYYYAKNIEQKFQPDIFSYSFLGNFGKFLMKDHNSENIVLLDQQPLSVSLLKDLSTLTGAIITDQGGRKFSFTEYTNVGASAYSQAWTLKNIVSATDPTNEINYTYGSGRLVDFMIRSDGYLRDDNETQNVWTRCDLDPEYFTPFHEMMPYYNGVVNKSYRNIKYQDKAPLQISFKHGFVRFNYDNTTGLLSGVQVLDKDENLIKRIEFVHYKPAPMSGVKRYYFLKKVKYYDSNNGFVNEHAFNYLDEDFQIPEFVSVDYWGYCNGSLQDLGEFSSLIPRFYINFWDAVGNFPSTTIGHNYRRSSEEYMKKFVLSEIIHPTGGKTAFEFEANQYTNNLGPIPNNYASNTVGGLRVKRILNYSDDTHLASAKEYDYLQARMDVLPERKYFTRTQRMHFLRSDGFNFETFRRVSVSSEPLVNLAPHGSPVVYPQVRERTKKVLPNGTLDPYESTSILYDYDYVPFDGYAFTETNGLEGSSSYPMYAPYNGLIKPANDGKLISTYYEGGSEEGITYEYEEIPAEGFNSFYSERYSQYLPDPCPPADPISPIYTDPDYPRSYGSADFFLNYGDITVSPSWKRLKSVSETKQGVVTTTSFEYNNNPHRQPVARIVTNSKNQQIRTSLVYPHELQSSGTANVYNEMVNRHIWSPVIEEAQFKGSPGVLLQKQKTNFDYWNANSWTSTAAGSLIVPRSVQLKFGANPEKTRLVYDQYTSTGNTLTVSKVNDSKISYVWGYDDFLPIAEVMNAAVKDIFHTGFEEAGSGIVSGGKTGTRSKTGGFVKNLTNLTNGKYKLSYWQFSGSVWNLISSIVTVSSGTYTINISGRVDDVRFYPEGARMVTFTYQPLVGKTSTTDANNKTEYYEYDPAGRLIHVLDDKMNIIRKNEYAFQSATSSATAANWQNTGNSYCEPCALNTAFLTGYLKVEQSDNNSSSHTYGQKRWINQPTSTCGDGSGNWQNLNEFRCVQDGGYNTGIQERRQLNINPCSPSYNETRWVSLGVNTNACPVPSSFLSQDKSGNYTKTNCPQDYQGSQVYVSVPQGMFSSTVSAADANAQALAYAQSQANANPAGTCTPVPFMLQGQLLTSDKHQIELYEPGTSTVLYTFIIDNVSWGMQNLGNILPGTYDVNFLNLDQTTTNYYTMGCNASYSTYGYNMRIYGVTISSDCNQIEINE